MSQSPGSNSEWVSRHHADSFDRVSETQGPAWAMGLELLLYGSEDIVAEFAFSYLLLDVQRFFQLFFFDFLYPTLDIWGGCMSRNYFAALIHSW